MGMEQSVGSCDESTDVLEHEPGAASGKKNGVSEKHTPGPWDIKTTDRTFVHVIQRGDMSRPVAHLNYTMGIEQCEANARLIAAAPTLLDACKRALDQTDRNARPSDWGLLRDAINKATGVTAND